MSRSGPKRQKPPSKVVRTFSQADNEEIFRANENPQSWQFSSHFQHRIINFPLNARDRMRESRDAAKSNFSKRLGVVVSRGRKALNLLDLQRHEGKNFPLVQSFFW
jgi:hypothetical protein